ncbi:hypothetical protein BMA721280_A0163 [Burkholderia mallei 2002721280]|uniref:Uncharacterized protein n=1 Tax=Burkholderia pseudomallei (strain 1106a) TaxID=357348 RepID=A3NU08_BURP0|nr:hypothetical protein BMASAVP1_A1330 [Burkholderia mallei SAVP1]ABN91880.1 hypothetical protein BURPS1106A_1558 [Burkholderia pseudomallei 1106a]AFR15480.1 hypothetical protein BPC006_I1604 [Burkholderia pseudomallei BPC006]EDK56158.1 hypothetical protein BMAFMH_C0325 [Burkholderia mallei FMH]EDK85946.1 hypothetical protein BMA721280_A0163 [Burkholderia mallei 2002721280]EDP89242.1 hypothetical protein BMA10399_E0406 [Burkholderia mallei ATCC 10399]EEH27719.1 conserved hypothetical protein 
MAGGRARSAAQAHPRGATAPAAPIVDGPHASAAKARAAAKVDTTIGLTGISRKGMFL